MSDIIANAKQLLDGATPGPWHVDNSDPDWAQLVGPVRLDRNLITQDVLADVFDGISDTDLDLAVSAPELAQALAGETWEYSFQILRRDEWEHASDRIPGVDEWFPSKYVADFIMDAAQKSGYVCRLVRRRVSPPEVME